MADDLAGIPIVSDERVDPGTAIVGDPATVARLLAHRDWDCPRCRASGHDARLAIDPDRTRIAFEPGDARIVLACDACGSRFERGPLGQLIADREADA